MRNLIPRLQVAVARDRSRADRVLAGLAIGQEVYLTWLTDDMLRVADRPDVEGANVLGVVQREWSARIAAVIASGRQCRAWYVGELPHEKSPDGSFRMVLTVWCSGSSRSGWRDIGIDELVRTARVDDEPMPRAQTLQPAVAPSFASRIHDKVQPRAAQAIAEAVEPPRGAALAKPPRPNATVTPASLRATVGRQLMSGGLSVEQLDRIKDAVRRKLAERKTD